jgi:hypothetical protein
MIAASSACSIRAAEQQLAAARDTLDGAVRAFDGLGDWRQPASV